MNEKTFRHKMGKAQSFKLVEPDKQNYWIGYERGLRRAYHGENFGTLEEHHVWLMASGDESREQRSEGYRDGYGCTQNGGDCETCSLVNYRRDCFNNAI